MGYVVTLSGLVPGARADGRPWTVVRVEEAANVTGPFALIDTLALDGTSVVPSGLDVDPSRPQARSLTTMEAQLVNGWYRVSFADAAGALDPPSAAVQAQPSAAEDPLQLQVDLAADYVEWVTGRVMDASMPRNLERAAQMATALRTVQQVSDVSADSLDALSEGDVLASLSADGVSMNFRDTGTAGQAQAKALMVNPWPPLNRLLWMLMTPVRQSYWMGFLMGGGIPAWGVAEVDWSGGNRWGGVPGDAGSGGLAGDELAHRAGGSMAWPTGSFTGTVMPDGALD